MLLLILAAFADDADDYSSQMKAPLADDPDAEFRSATTLGAVGGSVGPVGLITGVYGVSLWVSGDSFGDASQAGTGEGVAIVSGLAILAGAPVCANRGIHAARLVTSLGRHTSIGLGYTSYGLAAGGGLSLIAGTVALAGSSTSGDIGAGILGIAGIELGLLAETGAYGTCWGQLIVDWVQHGRLAPSDGPPLPTASNSPPITVSFTPVVSRNRSVLLLTGSF